MRTFGCRASLMHGASPRIDTAAGALEGAGGAPVGSAGALTERAGALTERASALSRRAGALTGRAGALTAKAPAVRAVLAAAVLSLALGVSLYETFARGHAVPPLAAAHQRSERLARAGLLSLPLAAQGPVSEMLGSESRAYRVRASAGGFSAASPAQHLRASFAITGARVSSGSASVGLALHAVGYGSSLRALGAVAPHARANRVAYSYPGVSAWYANGPLGIEQGFTLARPPAGAASAPLSLSLELSGNLRAALSSDRRTVTFTRSGQTVLRYTGLSAGDARGRALHSWLELKGRSLLLRVETAGARFPIHIDPFLQQGKKLTGGEEVDHSDLGFSVALSAEGNTALIGGREDDEALGAAWVFTRSGSTWTQQGKKLTGGEESGKAWFGYSVALSAEGNTALIGGPEDDDEVGAAWVFTRSGSTWTQQGKKLVGSGETGSEGAIFGESVALSAEGNTALIGGPYNDDAVGAAWVFTRSGSTWTQQGEKFTGSEAAGGPEFGESVSLSANGDTALIGGPADNGVGAAWVFTRSGSTWTQQGKKLTGAGGSGKSFFGFSVALSAEGNTALVGGPEDHDNAGAAWVFTRAEEKWTAQGKKLTGGGESGTGDFGYSVALSANGNTALIGGPFDDSDTGAVWLFTRSGSTWEQQGKKLTGGEESGSGELGHSVALSADGQIALTGGPFDGSDGAAWVFVNSPTVTTGSASDLTPSAATLNATVNPDGKEVTECKFEYGPTAAYGSSAPCSPSPGSGESAVSVSASLTGLATAASFHFRVVASDAAGTSAGEDETFATLQTSATGTNKSPEKPAEAVDGELVAKATGGTGSVTVGSYGANSGGTRLFGSGGGYDDLYHTAASSFTKIEFEDCELHGAKTLFWFNPEANAGAGEWAEVTRQSYKAGSPACIKVEVEASGTSPTIAQLDGTRFGDATKILAPEFAKCVAAPFKGEGKQKTYEGFFTTSTCTVKSESYTGAPTGKYELEVEALQKASFKTKLASGSMTLESAAASSKVTCTGESGGGEYTGQQTLAGAAMTLTGCTHHSEACASAGAASGEVVTRPLEGALGIDKRGKASTADKLGLALYPVGKTGAFMEFSCGATDVSVRGAVIVPVKSDKMSLTQALKFSASKGKQKPQGFEGEPAEILEASFDGGAYEQTGLSASITQTNASEVEIDAAF
ncbi:MAG TPA: hypothetical protein VMF09_03740 [Solirubrobacteraceae bacterium]|nr:hypothetical protein [Solirubrobacteraceae bacterium]